MHRSILAPVVALVLLAGVTSACRTAEAPRDIEPEVAVPARSSKKPPLETVVAARLNLRAGPGVEHAIVGRLARGARVRVLEEARGWKRVRPDAGGLEGWVAGEYLQRPPTP